DVIVLDNLSNSKKSAVKYIGQITGKDFPFYQYDLRDIEKVRSVFEIETIDAVIHLAGYKAVGESVKKPLMYYENNIMGTLSLLQCMGEHDVKTMIFSSSATVYTGALGEKPFKALTEDSPLAVTNPYGRTKLIIEEILSDLYQSDPEWNIISLRYFNPIGAHESGLLGDDPNGIPNNLMPYIVRVAAGQLEKLSIFGDDYDTIDGTGVRDYIHITDLADGHVAALKKLKDCRGVFEVYNLGTGKGYSVLDIVNTFGCVNDVKIPYEFAPRREGDVAVCFADPTKAERDLGWKATRTLEDMCKDSWHFQQIFSENNHTID
ncbi:MAG TPA: UDP-glucose 4-epimerase GalE, partial [Clostridiales bacterium]|nr:UDP-glucose 4-epimerase GalE [Clostridiales bacterium]